jgi:hypothetical protein
MFEFVSTFGPYLMRLFSFVLSYFKVWSEARIRSGSITMVFIHILGSGTVPRSSSLRRMFFNSNMKNYQDGDWFLVDDVVRVVGVAHSICASQ